jgi:peroxiredoxin Q/BCP
MVVGVSPDSLESHRSFREELAISFTLVSDPDRKVIGLYGVRRRIGAAQTKRMTYLIDKVGVIRGVFHHELAIGRHHRRVLDALRAINDAGRGEAR